jgi:UPF0271 protein
MEININCDLGEKSKHHSNKYDPDLLEIVNSANVACGFHAGDDESMNQVVQISKKNGVSIGAHPSFNDPENFGRQRMNLSSEEVRKLIIDQYEILQKIAQDHGENVTHIKPHGALNNMACEDIELATTLAKAINEISKDLIYLVPTGSKMEEAAKKLNMKIACEIFADRNYEDDGNLVSRKKPHALITDPEEAKKHVLNMVKNQSLNCHSGKQIPCEIDSVCIHGDNESSLATARSIRENLVENGLKLKPFKPNGEIFIMIKRIFITLLLILFTSNAISAGSSSDTTTKKVKTNYDKAVAHVKSAKKYEKKGKLEKAKKRYEKAQKLLLKSNKKKPNQADTLNYLGFTTRKLGDFENGEKYYLQGLAIKPDHIGINEYLGELYVVTNRMDLAKERLKVLETCNCEEYKELKEIIEGTKKSKY